MKALNRRKQRERSADSLPLLSPFPSVQNSSPGGRWSGERHHADPRPRRSRPPPGVPPLSARPPQPDPWRDGLRPDGGHGRPLGRPGHPGREPGPAAVRVPAGRQRDELQRLPGHDRPGPPAVARNPVLDDGLVPPPDLRMEGLSVGRNRLHAPQGRAAGRRTPRVPRCRCRPGPSPRTVARDGV